MRNRQAGFTLLEICIAIAIFAIGALTSMSILVPAVRWGADAQNDFAAAEAAVSAAEYLMTGKAMTTNGCPFEVKAPAAGQTTNIYYPFFVECSPSSVTTPADVTITVYRRKLQPNFDDEDAPPTYSATEKLDTKLFETKVKLCKNIQ